jgi:hypothetical protein
MVCATSSASSENADDASAPASMERRPEDDQEDTTEEAAGTWSGEAWGGGGDWEGPGTDNLAMPEPKWKGTGRVVVWLEGEEDAREKRKRQRKRKVIGREGRHMVVG